MNAGQASSTYIGDRSNDEIPTFVTEALLDLHYACLIQAKTWGILSRHGAILSSMGGRVSISTMLQLANSAGFAGRILTLAWKSQSEPESVIGGYAKEEENGRGPVRRELHFQAPVVADTQDFSSVSSPQLFFLRFSRTVHLLAQHCAHLKLILNWHRIN